LTTLTAMPPSRVGKPASAQGADTFPKLLLDHAARRGDRPANREKDYGIWQSWSWREVAGEVEALARGLAAMGFTRGDKLAIIGDNRPRLYWAMTAAQALGGIPVPLYQDAVSSEMAFVLEHAGARFAIAEDQEQVDKLLSVRDQVPGLEAIIYSDGRGMCHYDQPILHAYEKVQDRGREFAKIESDVFTAEIAKGKGSDTALILYTSGTTGQPKGVVLSYDNLIVTARNACLREGLREDEEVLAYLPMAWVGDNIFSFAQSYCAGFCVSCPESAATVMIDLRELGPTYFFAPPRIYETILTQVMIRMEDAGWLKRRLFAYFMGLAKRVGARILDGGRVSPIDRALYALGRLVIYEPLKNTLGFSRIRLAYTAGDAIGPDIFAFYRSLGINAKQLYGMTECSVFLCIQPDGDVRPDTVGTPATDVEIKIDDSGEVLYRSPGVFQDYYKNPEATAAAKRPDGWVHSGDAGFLTEGGQLKIIDRARDVGHLVDGTLFAPKYIENKLKFFPFIKEAVAFGSERDAVTAFINIELAAVGNWAERRGIAYASFQELSASDAVHALIRDCVEQVNRDLAGEPALVGSQIKRFLILHKELEADDGELTRTRKIRRRFIAERYAALVEALYSGQESVRIETEVTFEDGRKSLLKADLRIREAKRIPVANTMPALRKAS
jgi:long-chain acyl-CoA synthetase